MDYKTKFFVISMLLIAILIRLPFILDKKIQKWDECYHLLVAKNMATNQFNPSLYQKLPIELDCKQWARNNVWLSKGPIGFIPLVIGYKIAHSNLIVMRLMTLIVVLFTLVIVYKAGQLFSQTTAFLSSLLAGINGLFMCISTARLSSDHIETVFVFFASLFMWFLLEFSIKKNKNFLFLSILAFGMAFLVKWIAIFLLLPSFLIVLYLSKAFKDFYVLIKYCLTCLIIFLIITLPYFLYLYLNHFDDFICFFGRIFSPITSVIEGHSGNFFFT